MSLTSDSFLRDVAQHRMTVHQDQGLYRHLVFRNPRTFNQWFEIITWPGKLAISGDMGSWIFARVEDMFTFYRGPIVASGNGLKINPHYWAQKIEAEDRISHTREFSADAFCADAFTRLEGWGLGEAELKQATSDLDEALVPCEHQHEYYSAIADWSYDNDRFDEIPDGMVFTERFLWACHAIVWAIQQYDAAKGER